MLFAVFDAFVLLLHDHASIRTDHIEKATARECVFEIMDHPPYSPDLTPCDYLLFYADDEALQATVTGHL